MTAAYDQGVEDATRSKNMLDRIYSMESPVVFNIDSDNEQDVADYSAGIWSVLPDAVINCQETDTS